MSARTRYAGASGARDDALAGKTPVGEQTLCLQLVEHLVQLLRRRRLRGQLVDQLGTGVIAPGQQTQGRDTQGRGRIRHSPLPTWSA